jgi:hypothetical protein
MSKKGHSVKIEGVYGTKNVRVTGITTRNLSELDDLIDVSIRQIHGENIAVDGIIEADMNLTKSVDALEGVLITVLSPEVLPEVKEILSELRSTDTHPKSDRNPMYIAGLLWKLLKFIQSSGAGKTIILQAIEWIKHIRDLLLLS